MDDLAPYLADANADTANVPDALSGVNVIGRITFITEYDRESRTTFSVEDDLDTYRSDYDGASRTIKSLWPRRRTHSDRSSSSKLPSG